MNKAIFISCYQDIFQSLAQITLIWIFFYCREQLTLPLFLGSFLFVNWIPDVNFVMGEKTGDIIMGRGMWLAWIKFCYILTFAM